MGDVWVWTRIHGTDVMSLSTKKLDGQSGFMDKFCVVLFV